MYYSIHHTTRFRYSSLVSESVIEVRMQPRSDGGQRCRTFTLTTSPRSTIFSHRDYLGNMVHHFDVPGQHRQLVITADALVEVVAPPSLDQLEVRGWDALDALVAEHDLWDMLAPSHFVRSSPELANLARDLRVRRGADPLSTVREINTALYDVFDYAPNITHVHSPIEDALRARRGVCQDFAHVMLALLRPLGIPCRYISGYLHHRREDHDRSASDATHAWVEVLIPDAGWIGFDPTNNLTTSDRHIRAAVGRDYADVPPTRGVYRGNAHSDLDVAVRVTPAELAAEHEDDAAPPSLGWQPPSPDDTEIAQIQQQQ